MLMETYYGQVRTPADAIKLFEACRLGQLPRVQRRLSEKERQQIRSGSVFVWDEREAGMRRWTDGKSWSASRVSGSFLTYREMEGKRGSGFGGSGRRAPGKTPDSGRGSDEDQEEGEPEGYRYKIDGLMKQSFSITTSNGQHLHLISYYARQPPGAPELPQPSTDPNLRNIVPAKGMYPESSLHDNSTPTRFMLPQQQGPPPQPYPAQYVQGGYNWPPSPVATPPYSAHYTTAPYPPQPHHLPAPGVHHPPPPPPPAAHYAPAPMHHYPPERAPLPPPQAGPPMPKPPGMPQYAQHPPPPPQHVSPHLSQVVHQPHAPRHLESPRLQHSQHLQAQAAQAMGDPRLNANVRNPSLPIPGPVGTYATATPPNRALSVSPPRSSHSDANSAAAVGNKASLSALLHPTPANSEPSSANPAGSNSAGSSPRTGVSASNLAGGMAQPLGGPAQSEDVRALRVLDRKFCI